jgi:hypothetical protein
MIPPSQWDVSEQVLGGTGVLAGLAYSITKMMTFWRNEANNQASASATNAQFTTLQNQIEAQDKRIAAQDAKIAMLLVEMQRQDGVIHKQQTKLTRTEMLVRQLVGWSRNKGDDIPEYIQSELDDLIKPEEDRSPNAKTRSTDNGN